MPGASATSRPRAARSSSSSRARPFQRWPRWRRAPKGKAAALKIPSHIVGASAGPIEHEIDSRWLMAYSAALGETDPRYFDTSAAGGVMAHPLFPVCYEWPVSRPIRHIAELREHFPRLVHAEHDLRIHRPVRQGDRLKTSVEIVALQGRKPGAFVVFRFDTRDSAGARVTSTDFGVLYRGVAVEGEDKGSRIEHPSSEAPLNSLGTVDIAANAAHVYTECARIWNPIHTDIAHARSAGLPGIILHGTATLALSISCSLRALKGDPAKVRRIRCRFSGMVLMPNRLEVSGSVSANKIRFETRNSGGEVVVSRASIELDD